MKKIAFIIPPSVELLDLAGPVQVFAEAKFYGYDASLEFYSLERNTISAVGLPFGKIGHYRKGSLNEGDFIFIPGIRFENLGSTIKNEKAFLEWLARQSRKGINICSVCNAAFVLGKAGLLDGRECTTHWRSITLLKKLFPKAKVLNDALFVKSEHIYSSAGISAGIDLALSILEELTTPLFVNKVARGLVVYHRRSSRHTQNSIYLDYRNHINPKIHHVQDFIIENIETKISLEKLASYVSTSSRNLSRIFRDATGTTIMNYLTRLRLERAITLKNNPDYTISYIASKCGFKSARQLQRILRLNKANEK